MRVILVAALLALGAGSAYAEDATCKSQATDKKLAGAAKTSFTKKCVSDATGS